MGTSLIRTAQGQAGLALTGVLLIMCASVCSAYTAERDQERSRSVLTLAEHQGVLAHELGEGARHDEPYAQLGRLIAADANLQLLVTGAAGNLSAAPQAYVRLAEVRAAWSSFRDQIAGLAAGRSSRSSAATARIEAGLSRLNLRLGALATGYRRQIDAEVRAHAGHQALILAGTAPLLAWALFALARGATPQLAGPHANPGPTTLDAGHGQRYGGSARAPDQVPGTAGPFKVLGPTLTPACDHVRIGIGARRTPDLARELRLYAADFRQMAGLTVDLALSEQAAAAVPPSVRPQALNLALEAMGATSRQAGGTRVAVSLWQDAGGVWLSVADDGAGSGAAPRPGLSMLRARAERIGGELRVITRPSGGTTLLISLPSVERAEPHSAPAVRATPGVVS